MDASCDELDPGLLQTSSGFSLNLAGHISRESGPRDYSSLPSFFSSPSLSFSAFSNFTHLQPDGLLTEMESQAQLLQQHPPSSLSGAKSSNLFPSGEHGGLLCLPNSIRVNYNRGSTSGIGPTGIGNSRRKNDRDGSTLLAGNSLGVHSCLTVGSRQNLDTNQSN